MQKITASRYHDFSYGHRVYGHESKCAHLHGHNGRAIFVCESDHLDTVGRVIDFSAIKQRLCLWLEDNWDHKFLVWENDPWYHELYNVDPIGIVAVPFIPTAELMAYHLLTKIGPMQLSGTEVNLVSVTIEETRKCSAQVSA